MTTERHATPTQDPPTTRIRIDIDNPTHAAETIMRHMTPETVVALRERLVYRDDQRTEQARAEAETRRREQRRKQAERDEHARRQRVATHVLCEHVVAVAQCRGQETGKYYTPDQILPGRAVTQKVIANAIAALTDMANLWKERGLP